MRIRSLNRLWVIVAIAGLSGITSCKTENGFAIEPSDKISSAANLDGTKVRLQQDWLQFADIKSFETTIAQLEKLESEDALERWASKYKGFSSWRSVEAKEIFDRPEVANLDIPDPLLTTVLSSTGRIQIADTIYQIDQQSGKPLLYAIPDKYSVELGQGVGPEKLPAKIHTVGLLLLPFPRWNDPDDIVIPHPTFDICDFPSSYLFPWWGQKGGSLYNADNGAELIKDNGRNVRIDYHRWRVGFIFYSSIGVRVKIMKHTRLGGWMSTVQMNAASIQACSKGMVLTPGLIPTSYSTQVSASANNTNNLERTLKWVTAPIHVEILPEHFNFKFNVDYRGQTISRFIRE